MPFGHQDIEKLWRDFSTQRFRSFTPRWRGSSRNHNHHGRVFLAHVAKARDGKARLAAEAVSKRIPRRRVERPQAHDVDQHRAAGTSVAGTATVRPQ